MSEVGERIQPEVIHETPYERYVREQGWKVVGGVGVPSLYDLELAPGAGSDGIAGAVLQLKGMEGLTDISVLDLPSGWSSDWVHHFYEKWLLVLSGTGAIEFKSRGVAPRSTRHDLSAMSLAAVPLNMLHRLINLGDQPMRIAWISNAPLYMDLLGIDAVHGLDLSYPSREEAVFAEASPSVSLQEYRDYDGHSGHQLAHYSGPVVSNVSSIELHAGDSLRGDGFDYLSLEALGGGLLGSHVGEMNPHSMSNAHYHMGGAILICVGGEGYTLAWPQSAGRRPYESGNEGMVLRQDFVTSGAVAVGTEWYHQHLNPGPRPLRHVAFRYGKTSPGLFVRAHHYQPGEGPTGRILSVEELDPKIHADYAAAASVLAG